MNPRTVPDPPEAKSAAAPLRSLARRLLLASEAPATAPMRSLADELWALPEAAQLPRATLAAPLYAARTPEESARAARSAADALLRFLAPDPLVRPAVSPGLTRLFTRLDGGPPPPGRETRTAPAR